MTADLPQDPSAPDWRALAAAMRGWQQDLDTLGRRAEERERELETRLDELARLARLAEAARAGAARAEAARGVATALAVGLMARGGAGADWAGLLRGSDLFDPDWYLSAHADLAGTGIDPVAHFLAAGCIELRDPGPGFRSLDYHLANPDVAPAGLPGIVHWLLHGATEGRPRG